MRLTIALFATLVLLCATAGGEDHPNLSHEGYEAFFDLMQAQTFSDAAVGIALQVSYQVAAFRILMREPEAGVAFKQLVAHATTPGQLYGLCGLFFTDHKYFLSVVGRFRASAGQVRTASGCIIGSESAAEIVSSKNPDVLRLTGPKDSIAEWLRRTGKKTYVIDILGGGYPNSFLEAANANPRGAVPQ